MSKEKWLLVALGYMAFGLLAGAGRWVLGLDHESVIAPILFFVGAGVGIIFRSVCEADRPQKLGEQLGDEKSNSETPNETLVGREGIEPPTRPL